MASGSKVHRFDDARIERTYKRIESSNLLAGEDHITPEDVVAQEAKANPWAWGIWASMRLTGFLKLLNKQNAVVNVQQLIFALELTCMNWYNAEGLPITPEQMRAARKAAQSRYVQGIKAAEDEASRVPVSAGARQEGPSTRRDGPSGRR